MRRHRFGNRLRHLLRLQINHSITLEEASEYQSILYSSFKVCPLFIIVIGTRFLLGTHRVRISGRLLTVGYFFIEVSLLLSLLLKFAWTLTKSISHIEMIVFTGIVFCDEVVSEDRRIVKSICLYSISNDPFALEVESFSSKDLLNPDIVKPEVGKEYFLIGMSIFNLDVCMFE